MPNVEGRKDKLEHDIYVTIRSAESSSEEDKGTIEALFEKSVFHDGGEYENHGLEE